MGVDELRSRLNRCDSCLLGGEDELVEATLSGGEATGDGERPGDVCGVEIGALNPGVEEEEIAATNRTVVVGPVQNRGVAPRCGNGRVADVVPIHASAEVEDAFDDSLASAFSRRQGADHVFKAEHRGVHRVLEAGNFVGVLHETELREGGGEEGVVLCRRNGSVDRCVVAAEDEDLAGGVSQDLGQVVLGLCGNSQVVTRLLEGGAATSPQFAVLRIGEETVRRVVPANFDV